LLIGEFQRLGVHALAIVGSESKRLAHVLELPSVGLAVDPDPYHVYPQIKKADHP
jgi:hypothetical protein